MAHFPRGSSEYSRRELLAASTALLFSERLLAQSSSPTREPVIDIHQHIVYNDRTVEQLVVHPRTMGVSRSVLMPTGHRGEGHPGGSDDHEAVLELCRTHPGEFVFFANEISDHAEAPKIIERQLRRGAIGIGEQKFRVDCDSPHIERIAEVARSFGVPVLMHFEHGRYNRHIERFHRMRYSATQSDAQCRFRCAAVRGLAPSECGQSDFKYSTRSAFCAGERFSPNRLS